MRGKYQTRLVTRPPQGRTFRLWQTVYERDARYSAATPASSRRLPPCLNATRSSKSNKYRACGFRASNLVLAMRVAPESSSRASNKTTNVSLSAPIFVRECRRWTLASSRSVLQAVPRTEKEPKNERKKARKRNAERRVSNLRTLAGAARAERCALTFRRPTTALAAASERHSSTPATRFLGRD